MLLITDELVTDAFDFGGTAGEVRMRITGVGSGLLLEVDSTDLPTDARHPQRANGFGRLLVEELTADWGVHRHDGSKTAWAVLDLST